MLALNDFRMYAEQSEPTKFYDMVGEKLINCVTANTFEFSRNYTKLAMLSTLYCFVVKGKLIAKSLAPLGVEHHHLRIFIPMPIHMS